MAGKKGKIVNIGERKMIGLVERVKIIGSKGTVEVDALLDTGATRSSVDLVVAAQAGLGPITSTMKVKSQTEPKGYVRRAVVRGELIIRGMRKKVRFTLADREVQSHSVLIGRDVIHNDFVVDVERTHDSNKIASLKAKK